MVVAVGAKVTNLSEHLLGSELYLAEHAFARILGVCNAVTFKRQPLL